MDAYVKRKKSHSSVIRHNVLSFVDAYLNIKTGAPMPSVINNFSLVGQLIKHICQ